MKFLSVFIVGVAIIASCLALTEEQQQAAEKITTECLEEEGATKDDLAKLKDGEFVDAGDNVKCFTNCVLEKAGILVDGVFQESVILAFNEEHGQDIIDACKDIDADDKCEKAYKITECIVKNHGFEH